MKGYGRGYTKKGIAERISTRKGKGGIGNEYIINYRVEPLRYHYR